MLYKKCCFSSYGKKSLRLRYPDRRGLIVGISQYGGLLILWDGLKSVTSYHKDFIEILPEENEIEFVI